MLEFIKKAIQINVCCCLLICLSLLACNKNHKPKPKGYNHINFPEKSYVPITIKNKYSFEKNTQASVEQNDSYGWLNLLYKNYNAKILITHKYIEKENINHFFLRFFKIDFLLRFFFITQKKIDFKNSFF